VKLYRIPFSTNVERVALALGHKGLAVEWIDVDPNERAEVERISGQPLVPVLIDDRVDTDLVIVDSTAILRYLEKLQPEPRLWPAEPARRAELDIFLDWFNRVWKVPPNEIEAERANPRPDQERIEALGRELSSALDSFEQLLDGRDFLLGAFSAADCAAFPFLKYAADRNDADDEPFHEILREFQPLDGSYPRVEAWIRRVDALPRG
jgi:glutathione S-transferase